METATPLQSLRFTLERADWAAFLRLPREAWGWRRLLLPGFAILAGGGMAALDATDRDWPSWGIALVLAALAAGVLGLAGLVGWLECSWRINRKPLAQDIGIQLFDDHIAWIVDGRPAHYPINDLDWPSMTENHLALFAGHEVMLIPRRAFAGPAEMQAFQTRITEAIRAIDPD